MIRFFTWIFTLLFTAVVAGAIGVFVVLHYYGRGLPDYAQLAEYEPPVISRLYATDGRLFAEYASQKRVFVPIDVIPKRVIQTFLAAEDKNFYEHPGLDFMGIIRATFVNLSQMGSNKRPMGASTITQQVAKNLLLSSIATRASLDRKIKEAILSFRIENVYSKDRILELYLNEIYLGSGSYGAAAAALNYFNKSLEELTIAEAAFLAGLPKAPSRYNPIRNYQAAKARRDWVIVRMYEEGVITREEAIEAKAEPIELRKKDPAQVVRADYFAEEIRRHLVEKYGETALYQGGLTVRTTLEPKLQKIATESLRKGLITYDRRHGWRGPLQHINLTSLDREYWESELLKIPTPPGKGQWELAIVLKLTNENAQIGLKSGETGTISLSELKWARQHIRQLPGRDNKNQSFVGPAISSPKDVLSVGDIILVEALEDKKNTYSLQQIPKVSGALVAMDPHNGRVLAMTGGFSFASSQFNRVSQALRQPGSAIKPFVYLAAMERGFSPATIVSDSPISINMGRGLGTYSPKNVTSNYYGAVPLRVGLQKSLNMMTIRLVHQYVGMKPVARLIEKFNITDRVPMQIAMALGAGETTLLRLTTAYAMIANGGKRLEPTLIDRVQDRHGKTIFTAENRSCRGCEYQVWHNQSPPIIEDKREDVADPRSIYQITSMLEGAVRAGSARRAQSLKKIIAAKTGTTNEERDAWSFAYTPDLVVGTYIGYDNPESLGYMEGGSRVALPVIIDYLEKALEGVPSKPFKMPSGMKLVRMHEMSGRMAQAGDSSGVIYEALKAEQSLSSAPRQQDTYYSTPAYSEPSNFPSSQYQPYPVSTPPLQSTQQPLTGTGGIY